MTFDPDFLLLMPSTVQVYPLFGVDDYGEPTFSTSATAYRCLVHQKATMVRDSNGHEVVSTHTAYVAAQTQLSATSKYVLPGSTGNIEPSVVNIDTYYDEDGIHHNVVFFGVPSHA